MRAIDSAIVRAIKEGVPLKGRNTEVQITRDWQAGPLATTTVLLCGQKVATRQDMGPWVFDLCSWTGALIRSRINVVLRDVINCGVRVCQYKGKPYLVGQQGGRLVRVAVPECGEFGLSDWSEGDEK